MFIISSIYILRIAKSLEYLISQLGTRAAQSRQWLPLFKVINDQAWYVDSRATDHITTNLSTLSQKTVYKGKEKLVVGNGQ